MKISIGDIVDRFTICTLKKERLGLDVQKELSELKEEIDVYGGLENFIGRLYEVNSSIWFLESDIRKGNEEILGLEEIGRRALKIRDLNNVRVSIKNEINSNFSEGFLEVKMNHGSYKEPSVVITLTTVPERLKYEKENGLKGVILSLLNQDDNDFEVHFNIPEVYGITNEKYIIPTWLESLKQKYRNLKVFRTEDFGPPTKFVPTLNRLVNPETILLVVDDDLVYHKEMICEHRKNQNKFLDSVICYEGRSAKYPKYADDLRDSWVLCVTEPIEVTNIMHYKSTSYKKKLFGDDFFDLYFGRTFSDDVLVSEYFLHKNISMIVPPYEPENHLFLTKELWSKNMGVETFPVIKHSDSPRETGCNHPDMIKIQERFYNPGNLGKKL